MPTTTQHAIHHRLYLRRSFETARRCTSHLQWYFEHEVCRFTSVADRDCRAMVKFTPADFICIVARGLTFPTTLSLLSKARQTTAASILKTDAQRNSEGGWVSFHDACYFTTAWTQSELARGCWKKCGVSSMCALAAKQCLWMRFSVDHAALHFTAMQHLSAPTSSCTW